MIILKILGIVLAVILLIILVLLMLPAKVMIFTDATGKVKVNYRILWFVLGKKPDPNNIIVRIAVRLLGIDQITDIDHIRHTAKTVGWGDAIIPLLKLIRRLLERVVWLLSKCRVYRLHSHITVGNADAAVAAIQYGSVSAAVYSLAGFIDSQMKLDQNAMDVKVFCDFARSQTQATIDVVLSFRIFWGACALLKLILQNRKAGVYRKKPNKQS